MTWQTPKTDWTVTDGVTNVDFNRIEGNIQDLKDNKLNKTGDVMTGNLVLHGSVYPIISSKSETDGGSAYPNGVSMFAIGSGSGWTPNNGYGLVITYKTDITRLTQIFYPHDNSNSVSCAGAYIRHYYMKNWSPWVKVWHSGNDGAGSGLDADTIHGLDSSQFALSQYKGSTDLNSITQSGFYRIDSNCANAPSGVDWGQLLVMHGNSDTIVQIVAGYNSTNIYWRSGNPSDVGGAGTWHGWQKIWHEGNDGAGSGLDADKVDGHNLTVSTTAPSNPSTNDIWIDISGD